MTAMRSRAGGYLVACLAGLIVSGGCKVMQSDPPKAPPFGEVVSAESGVVVSVRDTMIDQRTGQARSLRTAAPTVPVGPIGVALPITIGGERRRDAPGEEITVKLSSGKLIFIVQELSQPPFAVGEQVKILHEKPNLITDESRTKVVREEDAPKGF